MDETGEGNPFWSIVTLMVLNIGLPVVDALSDVLTASKLAQAGNISWSLAVAALSFLPFFIFVIYDIKNTVRFFKYVHTLIWTKKSKSRIISNIVVITSILSLFSLYASLFLSAHVPQLYSISSFLFMVSFFACVFCVCHQGKDDAWMKIITDSCLYPGLMGVEGVEQPPSFPAIKLFPVVGPFLTFMPTHRLRMGFHEPSESFRDDFSLQSLMNDWKKEAALAATAEALLEAAPQLVLQTSIVLRLGSVTTTQLASLVMGNLSLAFGLSKIYCAGGKAEPPPLGRVLAVMLPVAASTVVVYACWAAFTAVAGLIGLLLTLPAASVIAGVVISGLRGKNPFIGELDAEKTLGFFATCFPFDLPVSRRFVVAPVAYICMLAVVWMPSALDLLTWNWPDPSSEPPILTCFSSDIENSVNCTFSLHLGDPLVTVNVNHCGSRIRLCDSDETPDDLYNFYVAPFLSAGLICILPLSFATIRCISNSWRSKTISIV